MRMSSSWDRGGTGKASGHPATVVKTSPVRSLHCDIIPTIKINDMSKIFVSLENFKLILYADDSNLEISTSSIEELELV